MLGGWVNIQFLDFLLIPLKKWKNINTYYAFVFSYTKTLNTQKNEDLINLEGSKGGMGLITKNKQRQHKIEFPHYDEILITGGIICLKWYLRERMLLSICWITRCCVWLEFSDSLYYVI